MLLQSLVALSTGENDSAALASLTTQLAEVTAVCDSLMLELVRIADQRAQIQRTQEVHISSALAMALRKLNASYAKRTTELREAREQTEHLKAELEEAWKVAEDIAQEMDDLDNFHSGFSSDEDEDDSGPGDDDTRLDESVRLAEVIGVTGKAVAMKARLTQIHTERNKERERNDAENHSQRVSAARKRSIRASKASLRLPKSAKESLPSSPSGNRSSVSSRASRSRSKSIRRRSTNESGPSSYRPPVPPLQLDPKRSPKDDSFLELSETRPVTPATPRSSDMPPPVPSKDHPPVPGPYSSVSVVSEALILFVVLPNAAQLQERLSQDHRATLDFDIPPITISPADGDADNVTTRSTRRVQSLQPDSLRRSVSEHKTFDAWPWQATSTKKTRRQSMPLTGFGGSDSGLLDLPPRVFSPPPSYTAGPSH
jgi:hypothetical protein